MRTGAISCVVAADERAILDDRLVFLRPVVVAGDRARADVHVGTDCRVAEVREMIGLRARPERGLLQLHEISDLCALADDCFRPQMRKRPDRRALCNPRTNDQAEVVDGRHGRRFPNPTMRTWPWISQAEPIRRLSLDDHTWMYHRVGAHLHVGVDVGRGRVDDRDAGGHQFFVLRLSHDSAHFREFRAAVDAPDFRGVVDHERFHRQLPPPIDGNQIRQVELALRVLRRNAPQGVEERREVERIDAAVDFLDLPHLGDASRSSTIRAIRPSVRTIRP